MKLTVVRHGETTENHDGIIQGQNPGHLSELGITQAQALADTLRTDRFDVIYCSDLQRCIDTAAPICASHAETPIYYAQELREISFGEYQGKLADSLDWQALEGTAITRRVPGGESWIELSQRVLPFINKIYEKHPDQKVLIVTHGGPMRVIRAAVSNLDQEGMIHQPVPNCAVWEFDIDQVLHTRSVELD